jgi:large-conductance mechanosensitive channel
MLGDSPSISYKERKVELTPEDANLEFALLEAKSKSFDKTDFEAFLINAGLPLEVVLRLQEVWEASVVIGVKTYRVGQVVIMEIARFIEKNRNLAVGIAIGAAVASLVTSIPLLGSVLAPLATAIATVVGGVAGARLDRVSNPGKGLVGIAQEIIILATKFFELLAAIFRAIRTELKVKE